jgi:hypothetical protein
MRIGRHRGIKRSLESRFHQYMPRLVLPPARAEAAVLAVVLAASATLTAPAPPKTGMDDLAVPPPRSGPVETLGARTGQIGIDVQASDGLLVVYLTAPRRRRNRNGRSGYVGSRGRRGRRRRQAAHPLPPDRRRRQRLRRRSHNRRRLLAAGIR